MILRKVLTSTGLLVVMMLITGVVYPLLVTVIAQAIFPHQANGSLIFRDGEVLGSELIGQPFSGPEYFWGRLSATSPVEYNAASSSGSNYGPINPELRNAVKGRLDRLRAADPFNEQRIPVDLATASGSGLDPHISIAAALYQVSRVARERDIPADRLRTLVEACIEPRTFGLLGEPRVNVLKLNLVLDDISKGI